MAIRSSSLQDNTATAINSKYRVIKEVYDQLDIMDTIIALDLESILEQLGEGPDMVGITFVAGGELNWNPDTKTLTVPTTKGDKGETGKSTYAVAVDNGFIGTEVEWLNYLQTESRVGNTANNTDGNTTNNTVGNTVGNTLNNTDGNTTNNTDGNTEGNTTGNNPSHEWDVTSLRFTKEDKTWGEFVDLIGPQGIQGIQGIQGDSVHHIVRTSGNGGAGTTDTYTAWGDVAETLNLGTFEVYNGADGEGVGDMTKSVYDTNNSGIVDNAEKVNSLTVETAVPINAVFTDTVYDDSDTIKDADFPEAGLMKTDGAGNYSIDSSVYLTEHQDISGKSDVTHSHNLADLEERSYNSLTDTPTTITAEQSSAISANASARHTHDNQIVLDKFSEAGGKVQYNSNPIGDSNVQSDWNQGDDSQDDFIKNKPDIRVSNYSNIITNVTANTGDTLLVDVTNTTSTIEGIDVIEITLPNPAPNTYVRYIDVKGLFESGVKGVRLKTVNIDDTVMGYNTNNDETAIVTDSKNSSRTLIAVVDNGNNFDWRFI